MKIAFQKETIDQMAEFISSNLIHKVADPLIKALQQGEIIEDLKENKISTDNKKKELKPNS